MRFAAVAVFATIAACSKAPEKSPHEITKEHLKSLGEAYWTHYLKTGKCIDVSLQPEEVKDCSKGCDPSVWDGAWPDFSWKPPGKSWAHYTVVADEVWRDQMDKSVETACTAKLTAMIDIDGDKQFLRMEAWVIAESGKASPSRDVKAFVPNVDGYSPEIEMVGSD